METDAPKLVEIFQGWFFKNQGKFLRISIFVIIFLIFTNIFWFLIFHRDKKKSEEYLEKTAHLESVLQERDQRELLDREKTKQLQNELAALKAKRVESEKQFAEILSHYQSSNRVDVLRGYQQRAIGNEIPITVVE